MKKQKQKLFITGVAIILFSAFWFGRGHLAPKANNKLHPKQTFEQPRSTIVKIDNQAQLDNFKKANNLNENQIKPTHRQSYYIVDKKPEQIVSNKDQKIYPNLQYRVQQTPNDTYVGSQWYLDKIAAKHLWDFSTGSAGVTTAVIDTGFALAHQDLSGQWTINSGEYGSGKESNGIDDDDDGYIDNWRGWNFYSGNNNPQAGVTNPSSIYVSHGSSTAGVIGAAGNNGLGVAGLSWQSKLLPLQTMSDDGVGYTSDISAAVDYAVVHGAKVINLSLGTDGRDDFLQQSIDDAIAAGITIVAAAGNDACDCMLYPANYPEVIAVGSTNQSDARSSFSSYGANLDLMAPGESILAPKWTAGGNSYSSTSGTSLAAPMVSGTAALILARKPTATPVEINQLLHLRSDAIGGQAPQAFNNYFGYGRLNAMKAASQLNFQNGALVQGNDGKVYLIEGGKKRWISSPTALVSNRLSFSEVQRATDAQLADFQNDSSLGIADGTLVNSTTDGKVYLFEDGKKRWILSQSVLMNQAPKIGLLNTNNAELNNYAEGTAVFTPHNPGDLVESGGAVYILESDTHQTVKRHILSPSVMVSYGYNWGLISSISSAEASAYPDGDDIGLKPGTLAYDSLQNRLYVISKSGNDYQKRWMASSVVLGELYPRRPYILVDTQELNAYADGLNITTADTATDGVIAQDSGGRVYEIIENTKNYITSPQAAETNHISLGWITNRFADSLAQINDGNDIGFAEGSLVEDNGKVYLVYNGSKYWMFYSTFFELGYYRKPIYHVNPVLVSSLNVGNPLASLPLTGSLIQGSDGKVLLVSGNTIHWIASPLALISQRYSASEIRYLSDLEIAQYSVGTNVRVRSGTLVNSSDGKVYGIDSDGENPTKTWILDSLILDLIYKNVRMIYQSAGSIGGIVSADDLSLN